MLLQLGKWKIFALESGDFKLDGGAMMGAVPKVLWQKTNPADHQNRIDLALRCLLLDDGENIVLVDTGIGSKITDKFRAMFAVNQTAAPLENELSRFGYSSDQISHVIISHLHFDHAGGATKIVSDSFQPTFPNARYFVTDSHWQYAAKPTSRDRNSYLPDNILPLKKHGVLDIISENTEILPGISTVVVNGHATGQQLVKIQYENEVLLFCGDLIPLKSHLKPPWIMGYDSHALLTLKEKIKILDLAATEGWWLYFYHDPKTIAVKIKMDTKYYKVVDEIIRTI